MDIVALVEEFLGVSERDHEQISLWMKKFELIIVSANDQHVCVRLSHAAIQKAHGESGTVAQVALQKLKCHLDWALDTSNGEDVDNVMEVIQYLSNCEEFRLAVQSDQGFTESFFRLMYHTPRWSYLVINLVNKDVISSKFLVEFLLKHVVELEFDIRIAESLSDACSTWSLFHTCLVDHPCAPRLVNKIVAALEYTNEASNVLRLSTMLLWLTKDRQLLDNETASRILKLATSTFEATSNVEEIEACCGFFTVSCVKTTMSSRLRRSLMAGLLRQLFEKISRTVIPCVIDLLIMIFDRGLLTPDFIQQHSIPLDKTLRWLNGHLMESVRAAKLLASLAKANFFTDSESRMCIGEELKSVLDLSNDERLELLGGFIVTTKVCLPSLYLSVARSLNLAVPISEATSDQGRFKWAFFARYSLVSNPKMCLDTQFCTALYSRGLVFNSDLSSVNSDCFSLIHKLVAQSNTAVQEKLEFYIRHHSPYQRVEAPHSARLNDENMALIRELSDQIKQFQSKLTVRDNELLSLQFRLSTESSKVLEYYELSQRWLAQKSVVQEELKGLTKAVLCDFPDTRTIRSYLDMLVGEVEALRQISEASTLKSKELSKRVTDLEERLMFTDEESRMYRETCETQAQQLRGVKEKESQLASHITVLNEQIAGMESKFLAHIDKINSLNEQLIGTEKRLHETMNQYHGTREMLAKAQLTEGQLRLELQSSHSLLEMRDQQIDSLKSQIQDLNTRLLNR